MDILSALTFLVGTWFIASTDFPMWTDGKKTDPQFHYTIAEKNGKQVLYDKVTYRQNGRDKSIAGYDYPDPDDSTAFTWRGKGITHFVKSSWRVAFRDPDGQWAVIYFSKTLFTPEGVDIIFRSPTPDPAVVAEIKTRMKRYCDLEKHLPKLKDIR